MAFYINYIGGPEQNESTVDAMGNFRLIDGTNSRWRHLIDGVADLHFDKAHVLVNLDYGTETLPPPAPGLAEASMSWVGGTVTVGYALMDEFAIAVRGGYFVDSDGVFASTWGATPGRKASEFDGTLTLAATPTPNLIIKLEPRIDAVSSDDPAFQGGFPKTPEVPPSFSKTMFTTTLGVVVTTN